MHRLRAPLIALVGALVALTGCSDYLPPRIVPQDPPPPATVFPAWPGCAGAVPDAELSETNDRPEQGGVPEGFIPVALVECSGGFQPDDSIVAVERRTTDLAGFLVELDRRGERVASGIGACPASLWLRPWWFLLDPEGRWVIPQVPVNACDHPFPSLGETTGAIRWTEVGRRTLDRTQVLPPSNGCSRRATASLLLIRDGEQPRGREVTLPDVGRKGLICRYDLAPATNPQVQPEGHYRSGKSLGSVTLTSVELPKFRGRCREQPSGFVVLSAEELSQSLNVEVDGCRRVIATTDDGYVAAQASPELIRLLTG